MLRCEASCSNREPWDTQTFIVRNPDRNLLLFAAPVEQGGRKWRTIMDTMLSLFPVMAGQKRAARLRAFARP
jgi:hypothetical protein